MTTGSAASTQPTHRHGGVGTIVDARVRDLQDRFLRERRDPAAVAALARLRRGVGKRPGEVLDVLEFTFDTEFVRGWPDDDPTPSPAEHAAHVAITLFAAHQQSRGERMHRRGRGLGTALRALHTGDPTKIPDPITRRFRMLGTADSFPELIYHLRGVVQLLRADGSPLDYGRLADELYAWQRFGPDRVRMTWGRQFYRQNRSATNEHATDEPETGSPTDQPTD